MSYFPDAFIKISKANGHKSFFWNYQNNEKIERCSELLEKARKFMNKDVELFWRVSSIFWGEMIQWLTAFIEEKRRTGSV